MHYSQYPADPDCTKCHGVGIIFNENKPIASVGYCDCRKYENIKKIQDRCEHDCYCRKCGKSFEQL